MNTLHYGDDLAYSIYNEIKKFVSDKDTDLMINEDGKVWVQNENGVIEERGVFNTSKIKVFGGLLASHYDLLLNGTHPFLDCQLPYDFSRVHIQIPPSTLSPTLSIRFHKVSFRDLNALREGGMITKEQQDKLIRFVKEKKNIIINGETGSGKTTLLSALINEIDKSERVVCIEDTREITTTLPNITHSFTFDKNVFSDVDAVRGALRQNPHRIIYGEVRDGRATLELIKAWNTGHKGGLCTIHANTHKGDSVGGVRTRLISLCNEVSSSPQIEAINEVLEVVVQLEMKNGERKVVNITNVKGE